MSRARVAMVAAATAGVGFLTKRIATSIGQLREMADRIGISVERLQVLQHAARVAGVPINVLNLGLQRMTRRISEAAMGTGEARDALVELGLDAGELNQMSPDQQFIALAQAMLKIENSGDRVRIAMRLFDSEGVALLNVLSLIADQGFDKIERKAKQLGLVLDREQVDKIEKMRRQWVILRAQLVAFAFQLAAQLAPKIAEFGKWMTEAIGNVEDFGETMVRIWTAIKEPIVEVIELVRFFINMIRLAVASFRMLKDDVVEAVSGPLRELASGNIAEGLKRIATFEIPRGIFGAARDFASRAGDVIDVIRQRRMRGTLESVVGEGVVGRAMQMAPGASVEQLERVTPGREPENIAPILIDSLGTLRDIRERIVGPEPARAG